MNTDEFLACHYWLHKRQRKRVLGLRLIVVIISLGALLELLLMTRAAT